MWALDGERRRGLRVPGVASTVSSARTVKHVGLALLSQASQFSESERPLERASPSGHTEIELKSLILAQIERWRHALHMQVERQRGLRSGGEWRTGE